MRPAIRAAAARVLLEGLTLAALALAFFGWLAREVIRGATLRFDNAVRDAVHAHAGPVLTILMRALSFLGAPAFLIALSVVLMVRWAGQGRRRLVWLFAITMAGAEILEQLLKLLFRRTRPVPFFGLEPPGTYSFPSGHAMFACCYFAVLAAIFSRDAQSPAERAGYWVAAAVLAGSIGLSRIYLGVHYPSDVIAGYAAGAFWILAVRGVYYRRRPGETGATQ